MLTLFIYFLNWVVKASGSLDRNICLNDLVLGSIYIGQSLYTTCIFIVLEIVRCLIIGVSYLEDSLHLTSCVSFWSELLVLLLTIKVLSCIFLMLFVRTHSIFVSYVYTKLVFGCLRFSIVPFYLWIYYKYPTTILSEWSTVFFSYSSVSFGPLTVLFGILYANKITLLFIIVTLMILLKSIITSKFYFKDNNQLNYFLFLIVLFSGSMIGLVLSSSLLILFMFWELLGVFSFLLICFYSNKPGPVKSALKAFLFNKFSDLCIYLSVLICWVVPSSTNLIIISYWTSNYIYLFAILVVTASFIKSAQFIFFSWLPDSMDAPLPASALIHSATLVSAGVFLCTKFSYEIRLFSNFKFMVIVILLISLVIGSVVTSSQTDLKKILAMSTITNCSFMYLLIFLDLIELSISYFIIHGILKSATFILFGYFIIAANHSQFLGLGIRGRYYKISYILPLVLLILNLSGFPFLMFYLIKHSSIYFNSESFIFNLFIVNIIMVYSLLSLIYGIKILFNLSSFNNKKLKNVITYSNFTNYSGSVPHVSYYSIFFLFFIVFWSTIKVYIAYRHSFVVDLVSSYCTILIGLVSSRYYNRSYLSSSLLLFYILLLLVIW